MTAPSWQRGTTLVELLVVLVLLGVLAGVVGLTLHRAPALPRVSETQAAIAAARRTAIRSGRPMTHALPNAGRATAHPDGSVITSAAGIDPLTGEATRDSL